MRINNFLKMTVGCIVLAMSVYFFEIPNGFSTGGVPGIGVILAKVTSVSAGVYILADCGIFDFGKGFWN